MGLNSWVDSDNAADFRSEVLEELGKIFKKEFKNKANEWNTPGPVNIALVAQELFQDESVDEDSTLGEVLLKTKKHLESIEFDEFKSEIREMVKNLGNIVTSWA